MILKMKMRKGIAIKPILILVIVIFIAGILILFMSKPSAKLNDFSDDMHLDSLSSLALTTLMKADNNTVNIAIPTITKKINFSKIHDSASAIVLNTAPDCVGASDGRDDYCTNITAVISTAPPKQSSTPEGISISVNFLTDIFYGVEGYVEFGLTTLYKHDQIFIRKLGDVGNCTSGAMPCFVNTSIPMTDLIFRVPIGKDTTVRVPLYYDNLVRGEGIENEKSCTGSTTYSTAVFPQTTKINVKLDPKSVGNSYSYTIVHMEQPHEREYAVKCGGIISYGGTDEPVQVTSGKYDLFRVYGWDPSEPDCVSVKDNVVVEKGKTRNVVLKFAC